MGKTTRDLLLAVAFGFVLGITAPAAVAEETLPPPVNTPQNSPPQSGDPPPAPAPADVRALSPDEVTDYQAESDSLAQTKPVQDMNASHWDMDAHIVLSVLLALVIFAVLVSIL